MFGVVVFGMKQELRFLYLDQELQSLIMSRHVDDLQTSFYTLVRQAEFAFLPLLAMAEIYRQGFGSRLTRIANSSLRIQIFELQDQGVTAVLIQSANCNVQMETVNQVLSLCFGPLLVGASEETLKGQCRIARRLLQAIVPTDLPKQVVDHFTVSLNYQDENAEMSNFYVTTTKILQLFLELFFEHCVDGLLYVESERGAKFYGGHVWNHQVLFLLIRLTNIVNSKSTPASRFTAFLPVDDGSPRPVAVDIYVYKLSSFCYVFGVVRMRHGRLLNKLNQAFVDLEKTRTDLFGNAEVTESITTTLIKLFKRQRSELKELQKELHRSGFVQDADRLNNVSCELSNTIKIKSDPMVAARHLSTVLQETLSTVYTCSFGSVQNVNLDLFNACCESLLAPTNIKSGQMKKRIYRSVVLATGPLPCTFDLDAQAYIFGTSESDLRLQSGDSNLIDIMQQVNLSIYQSDLCLFRHNDFYYVLMKKLPRPFYAMTTRRQSLYVQAKKAYNQMTRSNFLTKNAQVHSAFIITAYNNFVNISLAFSQTKQLAEQLRHLLEQSWHFHLVRGT